MAGQRTVVGTQQVDIICVQAGWMLGNSRYLVSFPMQRCCTQRRTNACCPSWHFAEAHNCFLPQLANFTGGQIQALLLCKHLQVAYAAAIPAANLPLNPAVVAASITSVGLPCRRRMLRASTLPPVPPFSARSLVVAVQGNGAMAPFVITAGRKNSDTHHSM